MNNFIDNKDPVLLETLVDMLMLVWPKACLKYEKFECWVYSDLGEAARTAAQFTKGDTDVSWQEIMAETAHPVLLSEILSVLFAHNSKKGALIDLETGTDLILEVFKAFPYIWIYEDGRVVACTRAAT